MTVSHSLVFSIFQPSAPLADEDDEDHGGLVKKIMESKKEYEQPRETKIVSGLGLLVQSNL